MQHESRTIFKNRYARAINDFHNVRALVSAHTNKASHLANVPIDVIEHIVAVGFSPILVPLAAGMKALPLQLPKRLGKVQLAETHTSAQFIVCCRKRPPTDLDETEFESVSCVDGNTVFVHDGHMHRNGRTVLMTHRPFLLDHVFDQNNSNDEVYEKTTTPLLNHVTCGGKGTMLLFGQTGTGKTYTTFAIQERIVRDLFAVSEPGAEMTVEVTCFEMLGKRCFDLLNDRNQVTCLSDREGDVYIKGATRITANNPTTLTETFREANAIRRVRPKDRNQFSSRSHAIWKLHLSTGGVLTMVDLAGSEGHFDTTGFSSRDHIESADINTALMVLKDCLRSKAVGYKRVPYRGHALTKVLRTCFEDPSHVTVLLATISPSSKDIEHTVNTLKYVSLMRNSGSILEALLVECVKTAEEELEEQRMNQWSPQRVLDFLTQLNDGEFRRVAAAGLDGKQLLRLPARRLSLMLQGDNEGAQRLFEAIREENRRVELVVDAKREQVIRLARNSRMF